MRKVVRAALMASVMVAGCAEAPNSPPKPTRSASEVLKDEYDRSEAEARRREEAEARDPARIERDRLAREFPFPNERIMQGWIGKSYTAFIESYKGHLVGIVRSQVGDSKMIETTWTITNHSFTVMVDGDVIIGFSQ